MDESAVIQRLLKPDFGHFVAIPRQCEIRTCLEMRRLRQSVGWICAFFTGDYIDPCPG